MISDRWSAGRLDLLSAAAILILVFATYANAFRGELFFDNHYILSDHRLRDAAELPSIWLKDYWYGVSPSRLWRPVTTSTYFVNYTTLGGGQSPLGYHALNIALHAACALLVLALLRRLALQRPIALLGAAIFACHPIATEAVTNIVGRADLLAALFTMSALLIARRSLPAALLLYALGLLSKESAVVTPALLAAIGLCVPGFFAGGDSLAGRARRLLRPVLAFAITLAVYLAIRECVLAGAVETLTREANFLSGLPWVTRELTAIKVIGLQLALLCFPAVLSGDWGFDQVSAVTSAADPLLWLGVVAIAGGLALGLRGLRRPPGVAAAGALWFLIALLPTSNVLFLIGTGMGERLLYLPSVGLVVALSAGLAALARAIPARPVRVGLATAAVVAVVALGVRTHRRNADWDDARTFWQSTVSTSPRCVRALRTCARLLLKEDWRAVEEPIGLLERAVAIDPGDVESRASLALALAMRARLGLAQNRAQDADRDRAAAAEQVRAASEAESRSGGEPSSHLARARATLAIAEAAARTSAPDDLLAQANAHYRRAIALDPTNVPFQRELAGFLLGSSREPDAALVTTLASILLMPEQDDRYRDLLRRACQRAGVAPATLMDDSTVPPVLRLPADAPAEQRARLTQIWSAALTLALDLLGARDAQWSQQIRDTGHDLGIR